MLDIPIYRLFRLRRTLVLGLLPGLATIAAISLYTGQVFPVLTALAVLIPVAHVVVYPNNWSETLTVALVLSVCLALASTIPPDTAAGALTVRLFALALLAFLLFFLAIGPFAMLCTLGPVSSGPVRAAGRSTLPPEALRKTLTYYPGRSDDKVVCGEPDAEGRFPVTLRLAFAPLTCQEEPVAEMAAAGISPDGIMECHGHAVIHSTGPDHHEVFYFDGDRDAVSVSRFSFEDLGPQGTRVLLQEAGTPMTLGERFGMWVSDYLADYLTDCIDAAEGRRPRANRAFVHRQLVVDLANILVPWMNRQGLDAPSDRRS